MYYKHNLRQNMAGSYRRSHMIKSHVENDDFDNDVWEIEKDLESWREVLIPLASLLRWDQPYYPIIIVGCTTFLFFSIWFFEMSTLTAVSLVCMLVGIFDCIVPFVGQTITGLSIWTREEESEFIDICETIAEFYQDLTNVWQAFKALRRKNAKIFFIIVFGVLSMTAWIGSFVDNFFLTYLAVNCVLLTPGLRYHGIVLESNAPEKPKYG